MDTSRFVGTFVDPGGEESGCNKAGNPVRGIGVGAGSDGLGFAAGPLSLGSGIWGRSAAAIRAASGVRVASAPQSAAIDQAGTVSVCAVRPAPVSGLSKVGEGRFSCPGISVCL